MNKVNTIVFCKEDYKTEQDWKDAVRDATFLLLNAQYQMVIRYDEPGLGIICVDFESSDETLGAPWPYWLTPFEAESVITDEERTAMKSEDTIDDDYDEEPDLYECEVLATQVLTESYTTPCNQINSKTFVNAAVEDTFNSYWKDLIILPDGSIDLGAVKNELADLKFIIDQVPKVYSTVTGGVLSKPMYNAETVIKTFYERYGNIAEHARLLPDDWDLVTAECKTNEDYKKVILDYLGAED